MLRIKLPLMFFVFSAMALFLIPAAGWAQENGAGGTWTFAVSGDSRNCGDFVMPAIASKVKAEKDTFYWHLGDFRVMSREPDQDLASMLPAGKKLTTEEYYRMAWDDFLERQMVTFGSLPVFLGRGNHETHPPMTRDGYTKKFTEYLNRPEIEAQRKVDGEYAAPAGPWYHWTENGVDFITLDNSDKGEFSDEQLHWLRQVLDHDLKAGSGITSIVAGMHEALPHSTGSEHAMDDWDRGLETGDLVYTWMYDAQAAGKHVYLIASHSHYYSPNVFDTPYWKQHTKTVVPGLIIGAAGAHRYPLPRDAKPGAKTMIYGFVQGTVHADGMIDFALHEVSEQDLISVKWPNAPNDAIHECFVHNGDEKGKD
ncbi:MAG TPA: metallophosphoesterase [Terracidiphilus sp.]|jgi:hypothetical protein|nr:metallophosphoesterase [Terracidiphilus sp.]